MGSRILYLLCHALNDRRTPNQGVGCCKTRHLDQSVFKLGKLPVPRKIPVDEMIYKTVKLIIMESIRTVV